MTNAEIMENFLSDMQQPAIQMALYSSFRKYAQRRDQLIAIYSEKTGIDPDEFHHALTGEMAREMGLR
jgi:hypothetical protein